MTVVSVGRSKDIGTSGESESAHSPESSENTESEAVERAWLDEIVELVAPPAAVLDHRHRILSANNRFCELCKAVPASMIGWHIRDVGKGILYAPAIQDALAAFETIESSEREHQKQFELPLAGGQQLAATIRRLPTTFKIARALLIVDRPGDRVVAHNNLPDLVHSAPRDPLGPLSAEALHHDIRQPLQTLSLLQGVLAMREEDPAVRNYLTTLSEAIEALGGMLNVLEELQHPSASPARPHLFNFPVDSVLNRLRSEFGYHAKARGFRLRVVPSRAVVHSAPHLLQQLVRTLLLAAIKMIRHGRVLLGCRRRRGKLNIEVWIGGEAVRPQQQQEILDEFHPSATHPNERGIVHSIVNPLSDVLGLSVKVRSRPGTGLLFTADVPTGPISQSDLALDPRGLGIGEVANKGVVAVVSDNLSDHGALTLLLGEAGYLVVSVRHDLGEVELEEGGGLQPEVIVADFSQLTDDVASLVIGKLRDLLGPYTPAIVIVDEAGRATQSGSIGDPVTYLGKPAMADEITSQVSHALVAARHRLITPRSKSRRGSQQTTYIVDDDRLLCDAMSALLEARGEHTEVHSSAESFIRGHTPEHRGCLVVDDMLPGLRGVDLLEKLKAERSTLPAIVITGYGDIETAVRAMRVGAIDYIEKPVLHSRLLSAIDHALEIDRAAADILARRQQLAARFATLTQRERQVLDLVVKGASSKVIARTLDISQRTVENHRAGIMRRMGATSLSDLIRTVVELSPSQEQRSSFTPQQRSESSPN